MKQLTEGAEYEILIRQREKTLRRFKAKGQPVHESEEFMNNALEYMDAHIQQASSKVELAFLAAEYSQNQAGRTCIPSVGAPNSAHGTSTSSQSTRTSRTCTSSQCGPKTGHSRRFPLRTGGASPKAHPSTSTTSRRWIPISSNCCGRTQTFSTASSPGGSACTTTCAGPATQGSTPFSTGHSPSPSRPKPWRS